MFHKFKKFLIGRSLPNEELQGERLNVFWGLPIMASDAISSVAYAVEEILWVLVPVVGMMAYRDMFFAAIAIIVLLLILVFSYRQTIDSYPHGGGSYTVAKENLGEMPGLVACASLIIGYILTVAVSTTAGTAAITSAIPALLPYKVPITIFLIVLMTIGNLRGVRESARIFALPTYIFIFSMLLMIVVGFVKVNFLGFQPDPEFQIPDAVGDITFFLMIRAFAAGCAGLTGVEAVSNAIPNFKEPSQKNAKRVLGLLALFVFLIFGGTSYMATIFHAVPNNDVTVLSQIAGQIFGDNFMYYVIQVATAIILVMAANTAFAGLPMLLSLTARDGYVPRQFGARGGRLGYSNGIIVLSIISCLLVIIYKADTHALVPLYAIGVFISFTLSQVGMLTKWIRCKDAGRIHKAIINGIGSVMTIVTVIIIAYSKMLDGAWITLLLIVILVCFMKITKKHYINVIKQLRLKPEDYRVDAEMDNENQHTIVLISSLNKASLKAINYARYMVYDKNIVILNVSIDEDESVKILDKWSKFNINIPLIVKYSPHRDIIGTLTDFIESGEHKSNSGDMITVVMPQFIVPKTWKNVYHNQTAFAIRQKLMHDRNIAVVSVPYILDKK